MVAPNLSRAIRRKNWEETSRILKDHPELAKEETLFINDFYVLWWYAPFETIRILLEVRPEEYKKTAYFTDGGWLDLVEAKSAEKQWDFLNNIFEEFPQVLQMKYASAAACNRAPLEFLSKYWKETGTLLYSVHNQDWEKFGEVLKDHPELAKEELSRKEFTLLWEDAPWETIQVLLKTWPEAHKMEDYKEDRPSRNLVGAKSFGGQWDFLDSLFQEFPLVLEMKYARTAAMIGAPLDFLNKYWKETGELLYSVHSQDWEKFGEMLNVNVQLVKKELSEFEFDILWEDGPLETIRALLAVWPEAYEMENDFGAALVKTKIDEKQWEFLRSILPSCPNSVTAFDVDDACRLNDVPLDVFTLMLKQQPNTPLECPNMTFYLIDNNKPEHFCAMLEHCPAASELKQEHLHLTPLLYLFQKKEKINMDWISPILKENPDSAKQKDFDGKTALHLSYQYGVSELINVIQQACPDAENERDNLGRLPKDLSNQSEKAVFTAANEMLILRDKLNDKKNHSSYPDNAVVVCRGDMLIRDPQTAENKEDKKTSENYSEQVLARQRIFETLLEEFSIMVGFKDKDVIQKAAALQASAVQFLSNQDGSIVNFGSFGNPGYWFQQEVLKLVMRVYCETQFGMDVGEDAQFCIEYLEDRKNGKPSPEPHDPHVKAYDDLTQWLTKGLESSLYTLQGPVLKPLQSLFNKLFIRRGQTSVHVIGDMVRGTLLVDDVESLQTIVKRIKTTFPNIAENQFRHPDSCDGLADFLSYVHDNLKYLPDSDDVLLYRFKANSSQKKREKPLWFNLNFFLQVPEYHCVGFSEMFVACELQIGVEEEINKHRSVHDAYERDRILSNQPLLKNYDTLIKEEEDEDRFSRLSNCTEDDNELIEKVLFGKIAAEVLIPCVTTGTGKKNNMSLFENGSFSLSTSEVEAGSFVKPERLCINNGRLNRFACPSTDGYGNFCAACVIAGPYELDGTKRYFVESFVLKNIHSEDFKGTIGLYAHVGPYLIQIACSYVAKETDIETEDIVVVRNGRNFSYLEQMCPVPVGTTALEVIVHGLFYKAAEFKYEEINLSLKVFDIQ